MPRPDEGMIHAWLDGELDAAEAARVERLVAEDAEWAAVAAEARGLIAASSRIVSALDVVPAGVIPAGAKAGGSRPRSAVRPWMRMAAGIVLVVGTASVVLTRSANAPQGDDLALVAGEARANSEGMAAVPTADVPAATAATAVLADEVKAGASDRAAQTAAPPAMPQAAPKEVPSAPPEARRAEAPAPALTREAEVAKAAKAANEAAAGARAVGGVAGGVASGVAGGVAGGVAAGAASESRERASVAAAPRRDAAPRDAAAREAMPAAALQSRLEQSADKAAESRQVLEGCWRVQRAGSADTLLNAPVIARQAGDTLTLVVAADGRTAVVLRAGADQWRGDSRVGDRTTAYVATRVECPRTPEER